MHLSVPQSWVTKENGEHASLCLGFPFLGHFPTSGWPPPDHMLLEWMGIAVLSPSPALTLIMTPPGVWLSQGLFALKLIYSYPTKDRLCPWVSSSDFCLLCPVVPGLVWLGFCCSCQPRHRSVPLESWVYGSALGKEWGFLPSFVLHPTFIYAFSSYFVGLFADQKMHSV